MNMFNIDDIEGSTHKKRTWNITEKLYRLDHVIVHTGWRPFTNGNTSALGIGYITDIDSKQNTYAVEWVDENGECREALAWIPREYLEKTNAPLDRKDTGNVDDEIKINSESNATTLMDFLKILGVK